MLKNTLDQEYMSKFGPHRESVVGSQKSVGLFIPNFFGEPTKMNKLTKYLDRK